MPTEHSQEVLILIAEDDDGHAELIREHLEDAGVRNPVRRFHDGLELMDFLQAPNRQTSPLLILLDIHMPRMDGVEALKLIKGNANLNSIPVIMLTTTDDPREVEECYALGCNCYVTKPVNFAEFAETLSRLGLFIMIIKVSDGKKTESGSTTHLFAAGTGEQGGTEGATTFGKH